MMFNALCHFLQRITPFFTTMLIASYASLAFAQLPSPHIAGGDPSPSAPPWIGSLQYLDKLNPQPAFCSATLIAPDWAITAAHCVQHRVAFELELYLGESDLRTLHEPEKQAQRYTISEIIAHPDYDRFTFEHDIALLRLIRPAPASAAIPVMSHSLFRQLSPNESELLAYGWGKLASQASDYPTQLRNVWLPYQRCPDDPGIRPESMFCTQIQAGKDTCSGDSGGPLISFYQGRPFLAGVISWGTASRCGEEGSLSVYTKLSHYAEEWLPEHTQVLHLPQYEIITYEDVEMPASRLISITNFSAEAVTIQQLIAEPIPGFQWDTIDCQGLTLSWGQQCTLAVLFTPQTALSSQDDLSSPDTSSERRLVPLQANLYITTDQGRHTLTVFSEHMPSPSSSGSAGSLSLLVLFSLLILAYARQKRGTP